MGKSVTEEKKGNKRQVRKFGLLIQVSPVRVRGRQLFQGVSYSSIPFHPLRGAHKVQPWGDTLRGLKPHEKGRAMVTLPDEFLVWVFGCLAFLPPPVAHSPQAQEAGAQEPHRAGKRHRGTTAWGEDGYPQ